MMLVKHHQACPRSSAIYGVRTREHMRGTTFWDYGITGIELACANFEFCYPNCYSTSSSPDSSGEFRRLNEVLYFEGLDEGVWGAWKFCPGDSFAWALLMDFDKQAKSDGRHPALKHISLVCSDAKQSQIPYYPFVVTKDVWFASNDANCFDVLLGFIAAVRLKIFDDVVASMEVLCSDETDIQSIVNNVKHDMPDLEPYGKNLLSKDPQKHIKHTYYRKVQ